MSHFWQVKNKEQARHFCTYIHETVDQGKEQLYKIEGAHRSTKQNAAFHSMCRRLANSLNEAGFDVTHPLNENKTMPWTEHNVKELLFRDFMQRMYGKSSTAQLTVEEMSELVMIVLARVEDITGVMEGFTAHETQLLRG